MINRGLIAVLALVLCTSLVSVNGERAVAGVGAVYALSSSSQCTSPWGMWPVSTSLQYGSCHGGSAGAVVKVTNSGGTTTVTSLVPNSACSSATQIQSIPGTIYVTCYGNSRILQISESSGAYSDLSSTSNYCPGAFGIWAVSSSLQYAACYNGQVIQISSGAVTSLTSGQCSGPLDIHYLNGIVYAACFTASGSNSAAISISGTTVTSLAPGSQCSYPRGIFALASNQIYVACSGGGVISVMNGVVSQIADSSKCPSAFAVFAYSTSNILAACNSGGIIQIGGSSTGASITQLATNSECPSSFDIVGLSSGNLYGACNGGNLISLSPISTGTTSCSANQYSNSGTCTSCPSGSVSSAGSTSISQCAACSAGTYATTSGCTSCAAGSISSASATSCTTCPSNTYSSGGTTCTACPTGTVSNAGSSSSSQCVISCPASIIPLVVNRPPYLDTSFSSFTARTVKLGVRVSVGYDNPTFQFVGGNNQCESYAAWDGSASFDSTCYKTFTRSTPWSIANPNCGLKQSVVGNEIWYTGYLLAKATQQVKLSNGNSYTRALTNLLGYVVRYPTTITISAQATFNNPAPMEYNTSMNASLQSAGVYSWQASNNPLGGEMVIVTQLPYPYYLQDGPKLFSPNDLTASVDAAPLSTSTCSDSLTTKELCVQYWKIKISPLSQDDATRCDFNGNYTLQFMPACQQAALGTKYVCTLKAQNITAQLSTSKYCPYLTPLTVNVKSSLTTYSNALLTTAATSFDLNSTIYFKLVVDAEAEIDRVQIQQATLTLPTPLSKEYTLVSQGSPVSTDVLANAQVAIKNSEDLGVRNLASLSFKLLHEYIPLDIATATLATLKMVAGVTFTNTNGTVSRRLLSLQASIPSSFNENSLLKSNSESRMWKRNFAKLASFRRSGANTISNHQLAASTASVDPGSPITLLQEVGDTTTTTVPDPSNPTSQIKLDSIDTLLLDMDGSALLSEAAFVIGPAHLIV